jgi:hypothetical protein
MNDLRRRAEGLGFIAIRGVKSGCDDTDSSRLPRAGLSPNHDLDILIERRQPSDASDLSAVCVARPTRPALNTTAVRRTRVGDTRAALPLRARVLARHEPQIRLHGVRA